MKTSTWSIEPLETRIAPATFTVTVLTDVTADDGQLTLREAVAAAEATAAADTIKFDPALAGLLTLTAGQIDITETLTIIGGGKITLSGNDTTRILVVEDGDPAKDRPLTVSGLRFVEGRANAAAGQSGGAISSTEGLKIIDCVFDGNTGALGGAVYVNAQGGTVGIVRSHFTDNTATVVGGSLWAGSEKGITITDSVFADSVAKTGGGAYVAGIAVGAKVTIAGSTFAGNTANGVGGVGGGLAIDGAEEGGKFSKLAISNSRFIDNAAPEGGGLFIAEGDFALSGLLVSGNTATNGGGGLFVGIATRAVSVTKSVFADNTASGAGGGGGILFDADVAVGLSATISATQIIGNQATGGSGGGVRALDTGGKITITGSLISGNTASSQGGGIAIHQNDSTDPVIVTLTGNTISGNNANNAGGLSLFRYGDFVLSKNVVSGNSVTNTVGGVSFDVVGDVTFTNNQVVGNRATSGIGGMDFVAGTNSTFKESGNVIAHNEGGETGGLAILSAVDVTISKTTKITGNIAGTTARGGGVSVESGGGAITLLGPVLGNHNKVNAAFDQTAGTLAGGPPPVPGVAANFIVTTLADVTADDGQLSLREAIVAANATPAADKIKFDDALKGVITLATPITISEPLTIYGRGQITLSGNNATGIFSIENPDAKDRPVTVSGLTFTKGSAARGGAIITYDSLTILDCLFVENSAGASGGAVFAELEGTAALTVKNSHFSGNTGSLGGGLFASSEKALAVTNSVFAGNTGGSDGGGANLVAVATTAKVSVTGSLFTGNGSLGDGAGLAMRGSVDGAKFSKASVVNSTFAANGTLSDGGGIRLAQGGFTLTGVRLINNTANVSGGGLFVSDPATKQLVVSKSLIAGNDGGNTGGGGVYLGQNASDLVATFTATQFLGNTTTSGDGGGLYANGLSAKLVVTGSLLAGNSADRGGGLATDGTGSHATAVVLTGNTIVGNEATSAGGLSLIGDGALALTKNVILANHVINGGAGAVLESIAAITLKTNSVIGNRADAGVGGLYLAGAATASFSTSGDIIAFNQGTTTGGLHLGSSISGIIAKNTKIAANIGEGAIYGGGITQDSTGAVQLLATVIGNLNRSHPAKNETFGIFTV